MTYDDEAIYQDADIEQAELEAAGSGTHATAVNDPDAGSGTVLFRCSYCGAGLDREPWDGDPRILNIHLSTIGVTQ